MSNDDRTRLGSSRFAPQSPEMVGRLRRPAEQPSRDPRQPRDSTRRDQDPVDVDPAQGRDRSRGRLPPGCPRPGGRPAPRASRFATSRPRSTSAAASVPGRVVDARLVDVQVCARPDAGTGRGSGTGTIRADHSGTMRSASSPPWARPRKLSAVSRAFSVSSASDCGARVPEVAEAVRRDLGTQPLGEGGSPRERGVEVRRVHARDDHAPDGRRGIGPRDVQADPPSGPTARAGARTSAPGRAPRG